MSSDSLLQLASDYPPGAKAFESTDELSGLRLLVTRGYMGFCAYVGAPQGHPLTEVTELNIPCHGSVTFSEWGAAGSVWEPGWYWWGWDYQHAGDALDVEGALLSEAPLGKDEMENIVNLFKGFNGRRQKSWTLREVIEDTRRVAHALQGAMAAAQAVAGPALERAAEEARKDRS